MIAPWIADAPEPDFSGWGLAETLWYALFVVAASVVPVSGIVFWRLH